VLQFELISSDPLSPILPPECLVKTQRSGGSSMMNLSVTDPITGITKCLDIQNDNTANHTPLVIWDCVRGGQLSQLWTLMPDGTIRSALNSNKCIDLPNGLTANNTPIDLYDCAPVGPNFVWTQNSTAQDLVGHILGYGGKCLDLPYGNMNNGTGIDYYDCIDGAWNETWIATQF
jgi:hypothetical protein